MSTRFFTCFLINGRSSMIYVLEDGYQIALCLPYEIGKFILDTSKKDKNLFKNGLTFCFFGAIFFLFCIDYKSSNYLWKLFGPKKNEGTFFANRIRIYYRSSSEI